MLNFDLLTADIEVPVGQWFLEKCDFVPGRPRPTKLLSHSGDIPTINAFELLKLRQRAMEDLELLREAINNADRALEKLLQY